MKPDASFLSSSGEPHKFKRAPNTALNSSSTLAESLAAGEPNQQHKSMFLKLELNSRARLQSHSPGNTPWARHSASPAMLC